VNADQPSGADAVDVYWRPGCGFCSRLLRVFDQSGVHVRLHNIWEDGEARRFVQQHNRGNETVPTVAVGPDVVTNPSPRDFVDQLRQEHPSLVTGPAPGSSAGAGLLGRLRGRASGS
jgi:mycoredoxin